MIISEAIKMLEKAKEKYGDLEVWIDSDYGQHPLEKDDDPLCLCPKHEKAACNMPERLVI
jgi:hypothetical protein